MEAERMEIDQEARIVEVTPKANKNSAAVMKGSDDERVGQFVVITPGTAPAAVADDDNHSQEFQFAKPNEVLGHGDGDDTSSSSETDTGKTLEPKPTTMASFFGFRRKSGSCTKNNFLEKGTATPVKGTDLNIALEREAQAGGGGDAPSASAKRASLTRGISVISEGLSSLKRQLTPSSTGKLHISNPWRGLKSALGGKHKFDINGAELAEQGMQDLKLHDDSDSEDSDSGYKKPVDTLELQTGEVQGTARGSFSEIELNSPADATDQHTMQMGEPVDTEQNVNRARSMAAENRIISLPYRKTKRVVKKEMKREIANYKKETKLTANQLKAQLHLDEKHLKVNTDMQIRGNKDVEKRRIQVAEILSLRKINRLKEHYLGGKCRGIMEIYRQDQRDAEVEYKSKVKKLQQSLEAKLIRLEVKKLRKERMLREKMLNEMRAVEHEILTAKAKLDAEEEENRVLEALLANVTAVTGSEEDTSNNAA